VEPSRNRAIGSGRFRRLDAVWPHPIQSSPERHLTIYAVAGGTAITDRPYRDRSSVETSFRVLKARSGMEILGVYLKRK